MNLQPTVFLRACTALAWASRVLALLCLGATAAALSLAEPQALAAQAGLAPGAAWAGTGWQSRAAVLVLLLPVAWGALALWRLAAGFAALGARPPALQPAHAALRGFAGHAVAATLTAVACAAVAGVLLTWHLPGQRQLAIGVSSSQVFVLLGAALAWAFTHILAQADALARENAGFV